MQTVCPVMGMVASPSSSNVRTRQKTKCMTVVDWFKSELLCVSMNLALNSAEHVWNRGPYAASANVWSPAVETEN